MAVNDTGAAVPDGTWWTRSVEWLTTAVAAVGALALGLLVVGIVIDVIGRTLFNSSLPGTLDLVTYVWMPLVALLPAALGELRKEHVSVDILAEQVGGRLRGAVDAFGAALAIVVVGALAWYTLGTAIDKWEVGEAGVSSTWLPIWPVRFLAVLALVTFLLQMFSTLRDAGRRACGVDTPHHAAGAR